MKIIKTNNFGMSNQSPKAGPLRKEDVWDALGHVGELLEGPVLDPDDFTKQLIPNMPLNEILTYDDYSSWGGWQKGELKGLPEQKLFQELKSYRDPKWAAYMLQYIKTNTFPPVVIVKAYDTSGMEQHAIGDGRGRVSVAVGMGYATLPAYVMTHKPKMRELE